MPLAVHPADLERPDALLQGHRNAGDRRLARRPYGKNGPASGRTTAIPRPDLRRGRHAHREPRLHRPIRAPAPAPELQAEPVPTTEIAGVMSSV